MHQSSQWDSEASSPSSLSAKSAGLTGNARGEDHIWSSRLRAWKHFFGSKVQGRCQVCGAIFNKHRCEGQDYQFTDSDNDNDSDSDSGSTSEQKGTGDSSASALTAMQISPSLSNQLSVGWHRSHIIPEVAGGKREMWNCLLCCADCNTSMGSKHLFLYVQERHGDSALMRVVRCIERKNPSLQCPGTLADFVYKHYRVSGYDFTSDLYDVLRRYDTRLEKLLSTATDQGRK